MWEFENKAKIVFEFFNPMPTLNKPNLHIERPSMPSRLTVGDCARMVTPLRAAESVPSWEASGIPLEALTLAA